MPDSFVADVKACCLLFAIVCTSAGLALVGAKRTAAQETRGQGSIRVDVNLVTVAFSARDAHGQLVDNLTKDDLDLLEDTVPQTIAHFARSADLPLTLGLIVDASGSQEHFTKKHQRDLEVFLKDVLGSRDRVFLVGFVPGWGYLGPLPEELELPRREVPRTKVPAGSVAIAGRQTGIYPLPTPGGWHLIGRTSVRLFLPDSDPPCLFRAGDRIKFFPARV